MYKGNIILCSKEDERNTDLDILKENRMLVKMIEKTEKKNRKKRKKWRKEKRKVTKKWRRKRKNKEQYQTNPRRRKGGQRNLRKNTNIYIWNEIHSYVIIISSQ